MFAVVCLCVGVGVGVWGGVCVPMCVGGGVGSKMKKAASRWLAQDAYGEGISAKSVKRAVATYKGAGQKQADCHQLSPQALLGQRSGSGRLCHLPMGRGRLHAIESRALPRRWRCGHHRLFAGSGL